MCKEIDPLVEKHYPELAKLLQEQKDAVRKLEKTMHEVDVLFSHFSESEEL